MTVLLLVSVLAQALPPARTPVTPAASPTMDDVSAPMEPAGGETRGVGRRRGHPPPLDREKMRALAAADPPIDALRAAATALVLAEPARARSLVERARFAGWLPELRVRVDRRFNRAESADLGSSVGALLAPVGIDSNNDVRYECRATWDLSRIIFNPDELAAQSQALRTADARREVESVVIKMYFERRRLKGEAAAADASETDTAMRLDLRIAEIEAELDALTAGAFTRLARQDLGPQEPVTHR